MLKQTFKPSVEREALAVVWGINHYRPYLFGRNFLIITDHKSLHPKEFAQILSHAKFMVVDNNIPYNLWYVISDKRMRQFIKQIVIPKSLQQEILKCIHYDKLFKFSTHTLTQE